MRDQAKKKPDTIRAMAMNIYIAGDCTLGELHKVDPVNRVAYQTLAQWSSEGGWPQKRLDFRAKVQQEVERRMGTKVAQIRVRQLLEVQQMSRQFFRAILELNPAQLRNNSKSIEGMAKAWIRMLELEGKITESIQGQIPGMLGTSASDAQPIPERRLSDKQAQGIARQVLLDRLGKPEPHE